jgi:hypothetical protein
MGRIILLAIAAAALSACAPANDRVADITSSDRVCVDSHFGQYCKDLQGNYLTGVQLASQESRP